MLRLRVSVPFVDKVVGNIFFTDDVIYLSIRIRPIWLAV